MSINWGIGSPYKKGYPKQKKGHYVWVQYPRRKRVFVPNYDYQELTKCGDDVVGRQVFKSGM